jgi:hypothetical protein
MAGDFCLTPADREKIIWGHALPKKSSDAFRQLRAAEETKRQTAC